MMQHFHNTFIILLYFILTCKELRAQQFENIVTTLRFLNIFHTKKCYVHDISTTNHK